MTLIKETDNKVPENYLNMAEERLHIPSVKVAFLRSIRLNRSKSDDTPILFYSFYDANGIVVGGTQFNVEEILETNKQVLSMENCFVEVDYVMGVYNNKRQLNVSNMRIYKGLVDSKFFSRSIVDSPKIVADTNKRIKTLCPNIEVELPEEFATLSLYDLYDGKLGAMAKLSQLVLRNLEGYAKLSTVDIQKLLELSIRTLTTYAKLMSYREDKKFIFPNFQMHLILEGTSKIPEDDLNVVYREIMADMCLAVLGVSKPKHFYSHIFYMTFSQCKSILNTDSFLQNTLKETMTVCPHLENQEVVLY